MHVTLIDQGEILHYKACYPFAFVRYIHSAGGVFCLRCTLFALNGWTFVVVKTLHRFAWLVICYCGIKWSNIFANLWLAYVNNLACLWYVNRLLMCINDVCRLWRMMLLERRQCCCAQKHHWSDRLLCIWFTCVKVVVSAGWVDRVLMLWTDSSWPGMSCTCACRLAEFFCGWLIASHHGRRRHAVSSAFQMISWQRLWTLVISLDYHSTWTSVICSLLRGWIHVFRKKD